VTRIALADDHAVVRKGLRQIIADAPGLSVAGEAGSADELLALVRSRPVDVVVLDLGLGLRSGLELIKHLRSEFPRVRILILSMHREELFAERALRAGASGYVQKDRPPEELFAAIDRVAAGGVYVSAKLAEMLAVSLTHPRDSVAPHERLSDREFEVFRLLGRGMSVTEIANALNLSVKTISTHRTNILEKTGLHSNADIVEYVAAHELQ
jgi:two-component system, NarL family, invasion response regulator UvrY